MHIYEANVYRIEYQCKSKLYSVGYQILKYVSRTTHSTHSTTPLRIHSFVRVLWFELLLIKAFNVTNQQHYMVTPVHQNSHSGVAYSLNINASS